MTTPKADAGVLSALDARSSLEASMDGSATPLSRTSPRALGLSDADLMAAMKRGDRDAFREIVERHHRNLVGYLTSLIRDQDRGEEIAQDAFIRLWEHRSRYQERGTLVAYLFRIATNLLRDQERKAKRRELLLRTFFGRHREDDVPTLQATRNNRFGPQETLLRDEATELVSRALADLPLRYRSPLVLREVEGWSYRDIASALGCREGTVKSRIHRGRLELRRLLSPYWNGSGGKRNGGRP